MRLIDRSMGVCSGYSVRPDAAPLPPSTNARPSHGVANGARGTGTGEAESVVLGSGEGDEGRQRAAEGQIIFGTIGTVLVDLHEYLPPGSTSVPSQDPAPLPSVPAPAPGAAAATSQTIPLPSRSHPHPAKAPTTFAASHEPPHPLPPRSFTPTRTHTPIGKPDSPAPSAPSSRCMTPQLSFNDSPGPASPGSTSGTSHTGADAGDAALLRREEVLGGGGLFAVHGARIWLSPEQCRALVDRAPRGVGIGEGGDGGDMTAAQEAQLEGLARGSWDYLEGEGRRMLRARIRYEGDVRRFEHIVKPHPRPFAEIASSALAGAEYVHVSPPYSPQDMLDLLDAMDAFNAAEGCGGAHRYGYDCGEQTHPAEHRPQCKGKAKWRPKFVYEPTPPACHPEQRAALEAAIGRIEVLSPNHEELLSIYARPLPLPTSPPSTLTDELERIIAHLLSLGVGPRARGAVVVRCGRLGSVVGTRARGVRWFPAYWSAEAGDESRVKDVTGAGNAYLGGLIAGLHLAKGDAYEAALYATVAASFVVEQRGLAVRTPERDRDRGAGGDADKEVLSALGAGGGEGPQAQAVWLGDRDAAAVAEEEGRVESARGETQGAARSGRAGVEEAWNGELPSERLSKLRARCGM